MKLPLLIGDVWAKVEANPDLQQEIINFWESNKMLPKDVNAAERALQVVLTVRHEGNIVGLTTSGFVKFPQLNNNLFYVFRMAVLPAFRIPGIESKLIVDTRDTLEEYASTQSNKKAIGMLTFVENPNLMAKRNEAIWPASKMVYIGTDQIGRHIRVVYFKGARI